MTPEYKEVAELNYTTVDEGSYFVVADTASMPDDLDAPSAVYDLAVKNVSSKRDFVKVTFTAVGDDLDAGTGISYSLLSYNFKFLLFLDFELVVTTFPLRETLVKVIFTAVGNDLDDGTGVMVLPPCTHIVTY